MDSLLSSAPSPKNKTLASWLAFIGGSWGAHRFYLYGSGDIWAWLHAVPTALGLWGVDRVLTYGQDDALSWLLLPLWGFNIAQSCLVAILYALTDPARWNERFGSTAQHKSGRTHWFTIVGVVFALMFGTIALMSSLVFSFQRYFEYQIEEARKISQ